MEHKPPKSIFLSTEPTIDEYRDGIIFGAPFDKTASYKKGSHKAPDKIREVSDSLESYSFFLKKDLENLNILDWGNIDFTDLPPKEVVKKVRRVAGQAREEGFFIMIGGEHTVTVGAVSALRKIYPELCVIVLDAHFDLRYSYMEEEYSHATASRRVSEILSSPKNLIQLGIRSGIKEELVYAKKTGHYFCEEFIIPTEIRKEIKDKPIYISIDIDVLDPSVAPGTGNPEPGGFTYQELISLLYSLKNNNIVGMDIVEVLPLQDRGDITSITAAKTIRESFLLWAK